MNKLPFWLYCLPTALRTKIEHRHNLQKILNNTGWLFADKIFRMGIGLLVGVWVARYLGPEKFGIFNYAVAIVSLFTAVATLGLNNIVVRDLIKHPEDVNATLGTACLLQLIGGVISTAAAVITVSFIRPDDTTTRLIVAIIGSSMIFKASDVIRYWFETKVQSKYTVWIDNIVLLITSSIKIVLILNNAPLPTFAWAVFLEYALIAALLIVAYTSKESQISKWTYKIKRAKTLLNDSWPLILAGLAGMLYMRIDQIMLGQILNNEAVGIYSAAVRISEIFYLIPLVIIPSVYPTIIKAKEKNINLYNNHYRNLFAAMQAISIGLAIPITFLSNWITDILYGPGYSESATVLTIHIWGALFVFSGLASNRWFVAENLQKYTFYRTLAGCGLSLILNYLLIPDYGPTGSAFASVISQSLACVFFNATSRKTRAIFLMQIQAIIGITIYKAIKQKYANSK